MTVAADVGGGGFNLPQVALQVGNHDEDAEPAGALPATVALNCLDSSGLTEMGLGGETETVAASRVDLMSNGGIGFQLVGLPSGSMCKIFSQGFSWKPTLISTPPQSATHSPG